MSHFAVLVIGNEPTEQLKPYQENNMDNCPQEYLKFIKDADCDIDKKTGKQGYWENPKAKWDWYSLGGRWSGFFKLKNIALEGVQGHHRAKDFAEISGEKVDDLPLDRVDQAYKKDIDFEGMKNEKVEKAKNRYEKLEKLCGGTIPKLKFLWKDILNGKQFKNFNIEQKRKFYHAQDSIQKIKDLTKKTIDKKDKVFLMWLDLENYQISKKEYIEEARKSAIVTFAVIKDGIWYENGEMGWWGVVSNEKDTNKWTEEFNKLINNIPEKTLLSVYDCHI